MKFDITSTYNSVDALYLKDDVKKQHSVSESWRDLDESELYVALGEMLDIRVVDGVAEEPSLEKTKENLSRYVEGIDEHFYESEFNRQMTGYHVFGQIRNAVKNMLSGLHVGSVYIIHLDDMQTTFEVVGH